MDAVGSIAADDHEGADSYVVFELGGESYALGVDRVREVLDVGALTRVPGSGRALCGLFNLRGHVIPVWDLRVPFRLDPDEGEGKTPCILMVDADPGPDTRLSGLLVDRVSDVLEALPEDIQPAPAFGLGEGSAFVRGLIRHHDRFLLLLDLDRVLSVLTDEGPAARAS